MRFEKKLTQPVPQSGDGDDGDDDPDRGAGAQGSSECSIAAPQAQPPQAATLEGPLGSWTLAELRSLSRFPHRRSFPTAKDLIGCFLRGELSYLDLRIALFWLGFGLLGVPVASQPTLQLVPLCKDLDLYADTAVELGYDPIASVHGQPVLLRTDHQCDLEALMFGFGQSSSSSASTAASTSASTSSSSSSAAQVVASRSFGIPGPRAAWVDDAPSQQMPYAPRPYLREPLCSTQMCPCMPSASSGELERKMHRRWQRPPVVGNENEVDADEADLFRACPVPPLVGHITSGNSASSNQGARPWTMGGSTEEQRNSSTRGVWELPEDVADASRNNDDDVAAQAAFAYKVKLINAGGWSSSSEGNSEGSSEGNRTPPSAPPASSSTASAAHSSQQSGGLDADHVQQFTVTFVSDLQMHEDLEEFSCLCTFCLDEMKIGEELCRLPCMHTFHRRCVHAWLARDRRCMLCRLDITRPRG